MFFFSRNQGTKNEKNKKKTCIWLRKCVKSPRPHQDTVKNGVLAQLVERLNGIEKVSGSNPLCSS